MTTLSGKTICFTGTLSMKRADAKKLAEDAGATVATTVTKKVEILVQGGTGAFTEKSLEAQAKGVTVWNEDEFKAAAEGKKKAAPAKKAPAKKTPATEEADDAAKPPAKKGAKKEVAVPAAAAPPAPAAAAPAAAATGGGGGRVVDRLVPNREKYSIHQDYIILLNQTNIGSNNNKYYIIQLLKDAGGSFFVWTRWGRVGEPGQNSLQPCGSTESAGISAFGKKFREKTLNDWNNRANFVPHDGKYKIVEMDEKDEGAGDSKAPMGKLSRAQIEKGQKVLEDLTAALNSNAPASQLVALSSTFFTYIPTNFGRQVPKPLTTMQQVHEKEELLKFYLRMGFEEVKEEKKLPPLSGIMALPVPKTLHESVSHACDKGSITSSVSKGDVLAKKQAGGPVRPMNKEEYGSIMLYTSNAIYRDLNKVLRDENRTGVQKYFSYLRLLFAAADALPQKNVQLWRGISVDLSTQYKVGSKVVWWGVSSCTSDQQVARNFMNGCGGDCSFITIDTKTAVDIAQMSFYASEKESLLMPGTELLVKSVTKKGKIAEIHLEEVGRVVS